MATTEREGLPGQLLDRTNRNNDSQSFQISLMYEPDGSTPTAYAAWSVKYHYEMGVPSMVEADFPSLKQMEVLCRDSIFVDL